MVMCIVVVNLLLKDVIIVKDVIGGKEINLMWVFNVFSFDFVCVFEVLLKDVGLFFGNNQVSKYMLVVYFQKLDQLLFGVSLMVIVMVQYLLVECSMNKEVFVCMVLFLYIVVWNDVFFGLEWFKLVNEGVICVNIQQLIDVLLVVKVLVVDGVGFGG